MPSSSLPPTLMPLGDRALLVRYGSQLDETVNAQAIALAARIVAARLPGVEEVLPNLVSVMVRYDPDRVGISALAGEIGLLISADAPVSSSAPKPVQIVPVHFGGEDGPDLSDVAALLGQDAPNFIARHCQAPMRVLSTGFAPGFVYCGMHDASLRLPRRTTVRPSVPAGSILFAAGQTAIASTPIPTGWHVIGRTDFSNFDAAADPPTRLGPGDQVKFVAVET